MNKLNLFKNSAVKETEFLADYWHKKPLLIRNAIELNKLSVLPTKLELQKLSCHEDIQSRIVFKSAENDYAVEYGPFSEDDYDGLNDECWNLLISDIDKWQPISRNILHYFNFIRNWIFDDIMVSCGSKGGTVGPHTDHYDVFLLQVHGQRQWAYTHDKIFNPELMPEQALKLMSQFKPEETQVLNPGDVLYLPPEVGHYGIAIDDACVTCSIGMRTPSNAELMTSFIDYLAQKQSANNRFEEPAFEIQPQKGEITSADIDSIVNILNKQITINKSEIKQWFGQYISEYRSLFYEFNQRQNIEELDNDNCLYLSPFSKTCYFKIDSEAQLFINGQNYQGSLELADLLCNDKQISSKQFSGLNPQDQQVIHELFKIGAVIH